MVLEWGRPSDPAGRLEKEMRVYDFLDGLSIQYLRADHPQAMTMEACREVDEAFGAPLCKNLLLCNRQQTEFYLLLIPGDKPFKTSQLSKQIGSSRLSFASGEAMEALLDITPGSVSILGLMNDTRRQVRLLIDADVLAGHEYLGCHPCINTASLKIRTQDILERFLPAVHHTYTMVHL